MTCFTEWSQVLPWNTEGSEGSRDHVIPSKGGGSWEGQDSEDENLLSYCVGFVKEPIAWGAIQGAVQNWSSLNLLS